MRNTILAAAAVLGLALVATPGFAAAPSQGTGSSSGSSANAGQNCADILADQSGHARSEVEYCRSQF